MLRKNIVLCGFMGCGKTTVGKELAWRLFYDFIDLDEQIEALAGMSIPDIFVQNGEEAFRALETKVFASLCSRTGQVIATGGGALAVPGNVGLAREHGVIVFVDCAFDLCYERIAGSDRPLLLQNTREGLKELFEQRYPAYQAACNFQIYNQSTPKDAAKAIIFSLL